MNTLSSTIYEMKLQKTIAFFGAESTSNEELNALSGFCEEANNEGWKVFVFNTLRNTPENGALTFDTGIFKLADLDSFDAIVFGQNVMVNLPDECKKIIKECNEKSIPVLSLGALDNDCYSAVFSNTECVEFVVDHLIEKHNCKTFNLIAGIKDNEFSNQRIESFKRALEKHNLSFDERRLFYGYFWEGGAKDAFNQFMEIGLELPDAFVCCNDVMALAICEELKQKGIKVPEDVIVTGYDGIEVEKYYSPRLTTVKCDCNLLGKQSFEYLKKIINKEHCEKVLKLEPTLVFSESCGCKEISDGPGANYAFETMGETGEIRHTLGILHHFATLASEVEKLEDLKNILPEKSNFGGEYWVLLNDGYTNISENIVYGDENQFSEKMHVLYDSLNSNDGNTQILRSEYLPDMQKIFDHGINTIVFMNLVFKKESIGYIAVPFWGMKTKIKLMAAERLSQALSQTFAYTRSLQKLEYLNYNDLMTGIHNRRGFYHFFSVQIEKRMNSDSFMILHSIDMDGLKTINDTYGHKEGDFAIKTLAQGLLVAGNETLIPGRFGGDEFVAVEFVEGEINPKLTNFKEKLLTFLNKINKESGKPYNVSCSIGSHATKFPPTMNVDQIIAIADELMYNEKTQKKRSSARV